MSLKAKLEAVVYAAEEPVTLAQLSVIFADEISTLLDAEPAQIPLNGLVTEVAAPSEDTQAVAEAAPAPDAAEPAPAEAEAAEAAPNEGDAKKLARQRDRKARLEVQKLLDELIAEYSASDRGMEIREIAGGYRMATKPEYHDAVRSFVKSLKPPMKLSLQALETLAVIAYKQPVTAPEVSEIRGVDSGGVLGSLISRKLITTAGRKPVIGRPILYKTTKEFLLCFGLKDVNDLPSMEEFEKMAGELTEPEAQPELDLAQPEAAQTEPPQAELSQGEPSQTESTQAESTPESSEPTPEFAEPTTESAESTIESSEPTTQSAQAEPTTESAEAEPPVKTTSEPQA